MSRRRLLSVIGAVVGSTGLAMLVPTITALIYREYGDALRILLAGVVTVVAGSSWPGATGDPKAKSATDRAKGFVIVGMTWITMTFFGTLPYVFTGVINQFSSPTPSSRLRRDTAPPALR